MSRLDVLSFGEAIIDFFAEDTGRPLVDVDVYRRHLGGAPSNLAVGLARQGVRAGLMTLVGPDDFGRFVKQRLAAEGVDVRGVGTHPRNKTAITFVAVTASGDRSFMFAWQSIRAATQPGPEATSWQVDDVRWRRHRFRRAAPDRYWHKYRHR